MRAQHPCNEKPTDIGGLCNLPRLQAQLPTELALKIRYCTTIAYISAVVCKPTASTPPAQTPANREKTVITNSKQKKKTTAAFHVERCLKAKPPAQTLVNHRHSNANTVQQRFHCKSFGQDATRSCHECNLIVCRSMLNYTCALLSNHRTLLYHLRLHRRSGCQQCNAAASPSRNVHIWRSEVSALHSKVATSQLLEGS